MYQKILIDLQEKYQVPFHMDGEIEGGWKNKKWLVNKHLLIKTLSKERFSKKRLIETEQSLKIQRMLYPYAAEIHALNENCIQAVDDIHYILMSYHQGSHKDVKTISKDELYELGQTLARIHSVDYKSVYKDETVEDFYGHLEKFLINSKGDPIDRCFDIFKVYKLI